MVKLGRLSLLIVSITLVAVASGCKKKAALSVPTPPPAVAPVPTATITATPSVVAAGDPVALNWSTANATDVSIEGIGSVPASGMKSVSPAASVSYHLMAKGPGGSADALARVTVNPRPVAVIQPPENTISAAEEFRINVKDIFFDYDKSDLRADAKAVLANDASYLMSHPATKIVIAGYCDERGSNEYNIGLGQNRANSAKQDLVTEGVSPDRIRTVSYGKEKPFCTESTETCWQLNRRAGFSMDR